MTDLDTLPLATLFERLNPAEALEMIMRATLREDLGEAGDITTASIVPPEVEGRGAIVFREPGVTAGLAVIPALLDAVGGTRLENPAADGRCVPAGAVIGTLRGSLASILVVERTLLNFVGHLSGIATLTRRFVDAVDGTGARICATRKTTPGLRGLEKYAVRCGGGTLHRIGLFDAVLYKDNHLARLSAAELPARLAEAIRRARATGAPGFVEVEVDTLEQLRAVLGMPPGLVDMVLLDNMEPARLAEAVALRDDLAPQVQLEASGGVAPDTVRAVAETGVDRISVGALTHSAPCIDVALDVE